MVPPDYMMVPEEEFDAYNDDTFGNDAETWTEDHHDELVGAHITEVYKCIYKPSYIALKTQKRTNYSFANSFHFSGAKK